MKIGNLFVIFSSFEELTDPRVDRTRKHNLFDMIVLTLCSAIGGAEHWTDVERFSKGKIEWFRKFLKLENGIPSHDTFGRVFALLDTEEFLRCLQKWVDALQLSLAGQGVAIDGKTLRRSFDSATGKKALHVVNAWAGDLHISLGQVAVDGKSNEITAVPKLLDLLTLDGAVVTLDAMHCQKKTVAKIREKRADYIVSVKDNQQTLHEAVRDEFIKHGENNYQARSVRRHVSKETNRGRLEHREYVVAPVPKSLKDRAAWKDLRSIGMVYRHRKDKAKESDAVTFFISSLEPKVRTFAKHLRGHWRVENSLHWTLDVTFSEDASRIRKGAAPEIASIFRRLALSILKRDTTVKDNVRGKRLQAGWNSAILEDILRGKAA